MSSGVPLCAAVSTAEDQDAGRQCLDLAIQSPLFTRGLGLVTCANPRALFGVANPQENVTIGAAGANSFLDCCVSVRAPPSLSLERRFAFTLRLIVAPVNCQSVPSVAAVHRPVPSEREAAPSLG